MTILTYNHPLWRVMTFVSCCLFTTPGDTLYGWIKKTLNSATKKIILVGSHPSWRVSPGAVPPALSPSDATGWWQSVPRCGPRKAELRTDPPTSALLAGRHIQSMPTAVKDVLELPPPARRILADMEVRRGECISIREPHCWKWSFAVPEASGGCV